MAIRARIPFSGQAFVGIHATSDYSGRYQHLTRRWSVSFFGELKRRNIFRVALVYLVIGWLLMQIGDVMFPALRLPEWITKH